MWTIFLIDSIVNHVVTNLNHVNCMLHDNVVFGANLNNGNKRNL